MLFTVGHRNRAGRFRCLSLSLSLSFSARAFANREQPARLDKFHRNAAASLNVETELACETGPLEAENFSTVPKLPIDSPISQCFAGLRTLQFDDEYVE